MKPNQVQTKAQFKVFAEAHGLTVSYSGKIRRWFMRKDKNRKFNVNALINARS